MASSRYPSDLSDSEWRRLKPHMPATKHRGRPRLHSPREILNAVFYMPKAGCQWRMLSSTSLLGRPAYHYFRGWRVDGTWKRVNRAIRGRLRALAFRSPDPSAGVVDSRSAKSTGVGGEARGYEGGKKVRGGKRHIRVNTEGILLKVKVHSARMPDQDGLRLLLESIGAEAPCPSHLWVDAGYQGRGKEWAERSLGLGAEVVHRAPLSRHPRRSCSPGRGSGIKRGGTSTSRRRFLDLLMGWFLCDNAGKLEESEEGLCAESTSASG